MSSSTLEIFSINLLNNERNVNLKFTDNVKVIVSENGQGKTTIISMLYRFLKKNKDLHSYNFKSLGVKIKGQEELVYPREILKILFNNELFDAVNYSLESYKLNLIENINSNTQIKITMPFVISLIIFFAGNASNSEKKWRGDSNDFLKWVNVSKSFDANAVLSLINHLRKFIDDNVFHYNEDDVIFSFEKLYDEICEVCNNLYLTQNNQWDFAVFINELHRLRNGVDDLNKKEFIYLPTYRLIESNLSFFRKKKDDEEFSFDGFSETKDFFKDNPLIQFGVGNIRETWDGLSNRIRSATTEDFLKLSGQLLTNIVSNRKIKQSEIKELQKNNTAVQKVISRINQDTLTTKSKNSLINLLKGGSFSIDDNKQNALFYILENMVTIYNNQKHIDETIESYREVINTFFIDKKVVFNEITSEIYVEKIKNNKKIDIENLSSGEKQILSIFTKIYLANIDDKNKKYWIFYDEPELSLSIEWQTILLPKIIESGRCEFLLAATHSPFIFKDSSLKIHTNDLSIEITEVD